MISLIIVIAALAFLMFMAYKGHSVILFAPIAAMGAVLLTDPGLVAPMFTGLFMTKMVGFIASYFPVFLLGAIFGKLMEISGFAKSIVSAVIKVVGARNAMLTIVLVGALLTYGGVSLFVVVFAVYPFAAEMFRQGDIPKRLIPGTIALGAFTFTMDAIPGTPQIQNIIPTTFFGTTGYAAPVLGIIGGIFVFIVGMVYLEWQRRKALAKGEGYGEGHTNEPTSFATDKLPPPAAGADPAASPPTCPSPRWNGTATTSPSKRSSAPAYASTPTPRTRSGCSTRPTSGTTAPPARNGSNWSTSSPPASTSTRSRAVGHARTSPTGSASTSTTTPTCGPDSRRPAGPTWSTTCVATASPTRRCSPPASPPPPATGT